MVILNKISNIVYNATEFIYNRTYNRYEILEGTLPYAMLQTSLGSLPFRFGDNPTAKAFLRDITLLPPMAIIAWRDVEIGSTGIIYDWTVFTGAMVMSVCKITTIGTAAYFFSTQFSLGTISLGVNFLCRPILRTAKVISREYQQYCSEQNCTLSRSEFAYKNFINSSIKGIKESIPKIFISNIMIGETFRPLFKTIINYSDIAANFLETQACLKILQSKTFDIANQKGIYDKAAICFASNPEITLFAKAAIYTALSSIEIVAITIREYFISLILVPISNSVADSIIPDLLFGSLSKFMSTAISIATTASCYIYYAKSNNAVSILGYKTGMASNKAFCIATGLAMKASIDITKYYLETQEIKLSGEDNAIQHYDEL